MMTYLSPLVNLGQPGPLLRTLMIPLKRMLERGYWVFWPPKGYRYEETKTEGRVLVRDEPIASAVQEALEGYASGRFDSQAEVKRFLEARPHFPKDSTTGTVHPQRDRDMLTQPLYAGYLEHPDWRVSLREARHEGLIRLKTFQRIQDRLKAGAKVPARADINADFPLRGFVTCADCGRPLTACWSRSKTGIRYPYYLCYNRDCASNRKSIARQKVEEAFEALLKALQPSEALFKLASGLFRDFWDQRWTQAKESHAAQRADLANIERQIEQLLDRIVEATTPSVIVAYEKRIADLERDKLVIREKLSQEAGPRYTFAESFEIALTFLSNPWKLWDSGDLDHRRTVLKLVFTDRLAYCRNQGFRTPKTTLPFNVLGQIQAGNVEMASPREEPNGPKES